MIGGCVRLVQIIGVARFSQQEAPNTSHSFDKGFIYKYIWCRRLETSAGRYGELFQSGLLGI